MSLSPPFPLLPPLAQHISSSLLLFSLSLSLFLLPTPHPLSLSLLPTGMGALAGPHSLRLVWLWLSAARAACSGARCVSGGPSLFQPVHSLALHLGGSGRAKLVWQALRSGRDPFLCEKVTRRWAFFLLPPLPPPRSPLSLSRSSLSRSRSSLSLSRSSLSRSLSLSLISLSLCLSSAVFLTSSPLPQPTIASLPHASAPRLPSLLLVRSLVLPLRSSVPEIAFTRPDGRLHTENSLRLACRAREALIEGGFARLPVEVDRTVSSDGTVKLLVALEDGQQVESVVIPFEGRPTAAKKCEPRSTLCVSSQVGCSRGCIFCATGRMGLIRNLTPDEILAQVVLAQRVIEELHMPKLHGLVFMGMGEPLNNPASVRSALALLTDPQGFRLASTRISVSTVAPSPSAVRAAVDLPGMLAWSVHAADDEKRKRLVPTTTHSAHGLRPHMHTHACSRHMIFRTCLRPPCRLRLRPPCCLRLCPPCRIRFGHPARALYCAIQSMLALVPLYMTSITCHHP